MTFDLTMSVADAHEAQDSREDKGFPALLGIRTVTIEAGRVVAELPVTEELRTPFGMVHGGVVSALVDHVLGSALYPVVEPGSWIATTEFKVNLLAPVYEGTIAAEAVVEAKTRRTAVVRIRVTNGDTAVALAQGTVMIMAPKS